MSSFKINNHIKGDRQIWFILLLLCLVSLAAVYSSSSALAYRKSAGNTELYFFRQFGHIIMGFALAYIASRIDFSKYIGLYKLLLFLTPFLILYAFFGGVSVGGAKRWISVLGISVQVSDIVRLVLLTNLAAMLAKRQHVEYSPKTLVNIIAWCGVFCGLLSLSSFSTAVFLGLTCFIIMWIGRVPSKYLLRLTGIIILCLTISMFIAYLLNSSGSDIGRFQVANDRIEAFLKKDLNKDGYVGGEFGSQSTQKEMALIAISRGGVFGSGPGNSIQKNNLPDAFSDFIYAIILEEYGILGGILIMGLYLWLLFRGFWNIEYTDRAFGGLLSIGLTLSIVLQAFAHMFINVGLGPVTGQPLPIISMGGTSLLATCFAIGMVISVSSNNTSKRQNQ